MRPVGRVRAPSLIAVVAALALGLGASVGCEWIASLDGTLKVETVTDSAAIDGATRPPATDASRAGDGAVATKDAGAPPPDFVFPPCSNDPGWQLDCPFGDSGVVLLNGASGDVPPALAVNSAGDRLEVAAAGTGGGTLYTTIGLDGGATTARLDAGAPVDINSSGPFDGPTILSQLHQVTGPDGSAADELLLTFFNGAGIGNQSLVITEPDGTSIEGSRVSISSTPRVFVTATHVTSGTSYAPTLISSAMGTPTTFTDFAAGQNGVVPVFLAPNVFFVTSGTTAGPYGASTTYVLREDGGPPFAALPAVGVATTAHRFENGVLLVGVDTANEALDVSTVQLGSDGGRIGSSFAVQPVGSSFVNVVVQSTAANNEAYTAFLVDRDGTLRFVALRQVGDAIVASTSFVDGDDDAGADDAAAGDGGAGDGEDAGDGGGAGDADGSDSLPVVTLPNIPALSLGSNLQVTVGNAVRFGVHADDPICAAIAIGSVGRAAIVCVHYVH